MTYLRFFLGTVLIALASVATLNFVVDPAGIYHKGGVNPKSYADALIKSKHGLWAPEGIFDERLLARAMSSYSQRVDCVVIGSSHVQQISSIRTPRSLRDICESILNLGVSGGGIEDHITLAYFSLLNGRPKKIILGVDPWTLAFGKDLRWSVYGDGYFQARAAILGLGKTSAVDSSVSNKADMSKLVNLINLEYTNRSVQTALRDFRSEPPKIAAAPKLDFSVGGKYPVRLQDGSVIYSAKFISDARRDAVPIGGTTYATEGILNQPYAINAYRSLLVWLRNKGVEPILMMTPYHENVFRAPKSPNTTAIYATEPIVMNLAHEMGVKVIGSYNPKMFGCLNNEFFDFMHPTADCVAKLRLRGENVKLGRDSLLQPARGLVGRPGADASIRPTVP